MPHEVSNTLASNIGKGLVAGLAGTAAMTVSSTLEAKLRAPRLLAGAREGGREGARHRRVRRRRRPRPASRTSSHWGYGTGWGASAACSAPTGLPPKAATAAHGAAVWGNALVMLPALEVAPPVFTWARRRWRSMLSTTRSTPRRRASPRVAGLTGPRRSRRIDSTDGPARNPAHHWRGPR